MMAVSPDTWTRIFSILPRKLRYPEFGDKVHKIATTLRAHDVPTLYRNLVSHWDPAAVIPGTEQPGGALWDTSITQDFPELLSYMQFLDLVTYLPDDILTKVDRASMAVALEARVPLIDHRVVEFAWRLPKQAKIRNGKSKWLLRQVLYRHVPEHLVERPKMGFGIPLADWLRGPLKDWAAHRSWTRRS
jgi:asparagine synthase (glutamine-hydrolysing)